MYVRAWFNILFGLWRDHEYVPRVRKRWPSGGKWKIIHIWYCWWERKSKVRSWLGKIENIRDSLACNEKEMELD